MGPGWYYVTLWVVGEAEGEGGRRKITNWVTQAFMRADVFFIQSDTDMPGNIFSLCSKEQDLKSFRSGDYLYTSEFIRIHLNHVQTCLFIASDDAISKFLFGSSE